MAGKVIDLRDAEKLLRRRRHRLNRRAAMVVHAYYPLDTHVRRHAQALTQRGIQVDVIALRDDGEPAREQVAGVNVYRLPIGRNRDRSRSLYALEYLAFFVMALATLTGLAARRHYAVVQVHTPPDALVFCTLGCRLMGTSVVLDIHDLGPELYTSKFKLAPHDTLYKVLARLEQTAVRYADRVVTSSGAFRERLIERGADPDKVAALLNSPDPRLFDRFALRHPNGGAKLARMQQEGPDGFVIVNHGTLVERYGLHNAVRAVDLLRDEIPGIRLRIYGDGDHRPTLARLVGELGLEGVVSLEGYVDAARVADTIGTADVGIVPSLLDSHMNLAMPTKLLEYVMLGVPVVATRTPVLTGLFGDDEIRYAEASPESLADALRWVYRNREEADRMAARAYNAFRPHRWERTRRIYFETIGAS